MRGPIAACLLASAVLGMSSPACIASERKLLVVVVDKVTWHDLLAEDVRAPTLRRLAEEGAPGMMCVRAGRGFGGEYATIGAGSRASSRMDPATRASVEADASQVDESVGAVAAGSVFTTRTGWATGDSQIVHLGIGDLLNQNADASYPIRLGLLGGELRRAGIRVACVGNGDTSETAHREAVAIAMDEHGLVPLGDVSEELLDSAPALPGGLTNDPRRLVASVVRLSRVADMVVLDTGETARADKFAEWMTEAAAAAARRRALERTDRLLSTVLSLLPRDRWSVLLITPSMRSPGRKESFAALAPVIWRPFDSTQGRAAGAAELLTSPSTRRPGIVANTDVAPTILSYFGLAVPREMVGRPFTPQRTEGAALDRLRADLARQDAVETFRSQLSRAVPITGAAALWLSALLMLIGPRAPAGLRSITRALLLIALSAPSAMLLVALRPLEPLQIVTVVAGLSLVIALASVLVTRWRSGYALASLLLVVLLVYDLLTGERMLSWSPLSYSPAAGARFYGIGNEYGGALLGAALIAAAWVLRPRERSSVAGRLLIGLILLGLTVLVGLPGYGANLGMSLSTGLGAAVFCLYLWRKDVGWPQVLGAAALAVAAVGGAMAVDYLRHGPETSHIGRWIAAVQQQGWQAVVSVVTRKLGMNLMLVRTSVWTDAGVAALGVLGVAVAARPAPMLEALGERPWLTPAVVSAFAGGAAAFALNDSGIVAAAIILIYAAGALAYVALGERAAPEAGKQ